MINKLTLQLDHGTVYGSYFQSTKNNSPLVIITNGLNGFYDYNMFPYIQEKLLESGISSFCYNFSHGGVANHRDCTNVELKDCFTEFDLYTENCIDYEVKDLK